jgi:hypothetical protein
MPEDMSDDAVVDDVEHGSTPGLAEWIGQDQVILAEQRLPASSLEPLADRASAR